MAYQQAESAKNHSERTRLELQELILAITEFLEQHGARPEDIRTVCSLYTVLCGIIHSVVTVEIVSTV